jgi:peptidoglycan hydrolase-like protein with peptidoglycan-binding domain
MSCDFERVGRPVKDGAMYAPQFGSKKPTTSDRNPPLPARHAAARPQGGARQHDALEREADSAADQISAHDEQPAGARDALRVTRSAAGDSAGVQPLPTAAKRALASPGRVLEPRVRLEMEGRFRQDFSRVRVHDDTVAGESARALHANAFTVGRDLFFDSGRFAPATRTGRHLLAHELTHVVQQGGRASSGAALQRDAKQDSPRFEGDTSLANVNTGASKITMGASGLAVTKLQQALVDLGYLPAGGATGSFDAATHAAVLKFQTDKGVAPSGEFDKATLAKLHTIYDTRKPYIDDAKVDPLVPGTHVLSATDKAAALSALVPAPVAGAPSTFQEDLGPPKGKYGPRMEAQLKGLIKAFHKELFSDKLPLRANPAANFFTWSALEAPALAAKNVVDKVYGSNYGGAAAKPPLTKAGGNLIDQWTDEVATNAGLTAAQKKAKAVDKVWYLINSNCDAINNEHSAVPSAAAETAILTPIVQRLVATAADVQTLLDLDIGWEGAQLSGKVYLQRFKSTDADAAKAKEANRVHMWDLFETCIHEYIHTLAHPDYNVWAEHFRLAGDVTRYNTLTEGFCDFFTLNVRKDAALPAVQALVEGPYANGNPPAPDASGVYPSNVQAEQVVSIVGIRNAQAAYFGGKTRLMGSP